MNCLASFSPGKKGRSALEWAGEGEMGENGFSEENTDMKSTVLMQTKEGNEAWIGPGAEEL